MSTRNPHDPTPSSASTPAASYRELERKLVPLPDSSHRPTPAEADEAEVPRPVEVTGGDGALSADGVRAAVVALEHVDATDLTLDVVGGSVTVGGSVARTDDRERIVAAVEAVPGVTEVIDRLRVRL